MDRSTLGHNLRPLERDGMVSLVTDPDDKRIRRVVVTEAGRAKRRACRELWQVAQERFEQALGEDRAVELGHLLDFIAPRPRARGRRRLAASRVPIMLAKPLSAFLWERGIHYGWVSVAVTFLVLLTTAGAMGLPGALILPLDAEFHWGTAAISFALALRIMLYGLMAPFAAALMNRYGLRNVITAATAMICAALATAPLMRELWQLMVLWGLVVGLATGMTAMVLAATVANRWFVERRGLVVGLLSASSATGQLVFLPLGAWLVTHMGMAHRPSCRRWWRAHRRRSGGAVPRRPSG